MLRQTPLRHDKIGWVRPCTRSPTGIPSTNVCFVGPGRERGHESKRPEIGWGIVYKLGPAVPLLVHRCGADADPNLMPLYAGIINWRNSPLKMGRGPPDREGLAIVELIRHPWPQSIDIPRPDTPRVAAPVVARNSDINCT